MIYFYRHRINMLSSTLRSFWISLLRLSQSSGYRFVWRVFLISIHCNLLTNILIALNPLITFPFVEHNFPNIYSHYTARFLWHQPLGHFPARKVIYFIIYKNSFMTLLSFFSISIWLSSRPAVGKLTFQYNFIYF